MPISIPGKYFSGNNTETVENHIYITDIRTGTKALCVNFKCCKSFICESIEHTYRSKDKIIVILIQIFNSYILDDD